MKQKLLIVIVVPVILALAAVWTGCSPRKLMVRQFVQMVESGIPAIEQEQDLQLLAQSMPAHIKLLETVLANDPQNVDLMLLLARLYGGYAFAILETELEARRFGLPSVAALAFTPDQLETAVVRNYRKGAAYALQALETRHQKAGERLSRLKSSEAFIAALRRSDAPALFWYGFNLGGYIQHRLDSVEAMAKTHLVEKTMRRVVALDEAYYHGSAHLVLMAYYASRPAALGGNPERSRAHMERHFIVAPESMMMRSLYWARYALVQQQARSEFVRRLSQVADEAKADQKLDMLGSVAAVRARIYLEARDNFFEE
ncbi:MAG: TRAP transporter TatT component family protein [Desulfobacteraceae bacterium]|jgi:hypothetical protein